MIENFTLDTDANPQNMNKLIEGINKNEEDISGLKTSVEEVGSAIGQIANDRGYVNTKLLQTDSDFNSIPKLNGKYMLFSGGNSPSGKAWYFVDVTVHNEKYVEQKARTFDYSESNYRNFQRNLVDGTWTIWKETATIDKVITTSPWEVPQRVDANNIRITGIVVTASYSTNIPGIMGGYASTEGFLYTRKLNDAYIVQEFRSIYNQEPKWIRFLFSNNWTQWTTGSGGKQELEIPYNAGYLNNTTSRYNSKLVKNGLDQVIVYGAVKKADGSNFAAGLDTQIAIIPVGWKNSFNNRCGAVATELNGIPLGEARVAIFDGTIYVSASVSCPCIMFTIPYELLRY